MSTATPPLREFLIAKKLVIFDFDNTLVPSYLAREDKDFFAPVKPLSGRVEFMTDLKNRGIAIGIACNQAGVAFARSDQRRIREEDVFDKIDLVAQMLGLHSGYHLAICFGHPNSPFSKYRDVDQVTRRKPSGAMIRELMIELLLDPFSFTDRAKVLVIGDREEDAGAAMDAGVASLSSADVFGIDTDKLVAKKKYSTPENVLIFNASDLGKKRK